MELDEKYFLPESGSKALMIIPRWRYAGFSPDEIGRRILIEYRKAESPEARYHLAMMFCVLYGSADYSGVYENAMKWAATFHLPMYEGMSVGECALYDMMSREDTEAWQWLEGFSVEFAEECMDEQDPEIPECIARMIWTDQLPNIIPLDNERFVYALKEKDSKLWLYGFGGLESLNQAERILMYVFRRVGYPTMRVLTLPYNINPEPLFVMPTTYPISKDSICIATEHQDIDATFYMCLRAVRKITETYPNYASATLTDTLLDGWCAHMHIFA